VSDTHTHTTHHTQAHNARRATLVSHGSMEHTSLATVVAVVVFESVGDEEIECRSSKSNPHQHADTAC
jgi:hypothetical protein